jgi:hypothetical protein
MDGFAEGGRTMRKARFACWGLAIGLAAGSVGAQDISFDYDTGADFSSFRTYTWVAGTEIKDPFNHKRIVDAIDAQLAAKGLSKVEASAAPDLLVAYHASFDQDLEIQGWSTGWGGYRFGGSRSGTATVEEILIGTIAVDMIDAGTNTIVWRGTASKEVDVKADPEKREKNIRKAAEKLFKNYPPKKK